jgi:hypothetical protein
LDVNTNLEILYKDEDGYLTSVKRFELAGKAISQLLFLLKRVLQIDDWDLHLIVQSQSSRCMRIAMGDEDWQGNDLAKAKREAARTAIIGSKVQP